MLFVDAFTYDDGAMNKFDLCGRLNLEKIGKSF